MRDLHNILKTTEAIVPAVANAANTAFVTTILPTAGFDSNELVLIAGAIPTAGTTLAVTLVEGNQPNLSDASNVASSDLLGTLAGAGLAYGNANQTAKLGYKGTKSYIQATVTPTGNAGNLYLAALWIQGDARVEPLSAQIN